MKACIKVVSIVFILLGGCHSDLYTKQLAAEHLKDRPSMSLVSGYLDLTYTENEGIAFSMLESIDSRVRDPLLISLQLLSMMAVSFLIVLWRKKSFVTLLPFALIVAGGLGNVIDRIRYGHVVDFIYFHVQDRFSWPVFNVADILLTAGIGLLILETLFMKEAPLKAGLLPNTD